MQSSIIEQIENIINSNNVVLFMKGTKTAPQCGFSATVVQIIGALGVNFYDVDVLKNQEIRQGIKDFSDWPTIPQLYVKGQFIGGCDIVREMYQNGELINLLKENQILQ